MAAPIGNNNAVNGKRWNDAINRALEMRCKGDGIKALTELAEKLLTNAERGDMQALKEIGDRIDGRPAQSMTLSGDGDKPIVSKMIVELVTPK